ncbi:hypothetical protein PMIN03_002026 [Paraphaeosphaeria minitans]
MSSISSSAGEVMVWLNTSLPTDDFVIHPIIHQEILGTARHVTHSLRALGQICSSPWFNHIWVVQEIALAKQNPELYLGQISIQWVQFEAYIETLDDSRWPAVSAVSPIKGQDARTKASYRFIGTMTTTWCLCYSDPR